MRQMISEWYMIRNWVLFSIETNKTWKFSIILSERYGFDVIFWSGFNTSSNQSIANQMEKRKKNELKLTKPKNAGTSIVFSM